MPDVSQNTPKRRSSSLRRGRPKAANFSMENDCNENGKEQSMKKWMRNIFGALAALVFVQVAAQQPYIVVASTTSTEQSGLFAHLLPAFEADTGINVRVVAVGTGQALDIGRRGDA